MEQPPIQQPKKIIVVGTYKRCSTDHQELILQQESINRELKRLQEDNPDTEYIIKTYEDKGLSGKDVNRPGLQNLLRDVESNKVNLVIFTKLDRLARSLQDLLNTTTTFNNHGVDFVVVEQKINTSTPTGKLLFHIIGAFSEFERTLINERTQAGRERAKISGSKSGKPCNRPKLDLDADGVQKKYELGMSQRQIARFYNVSFTPVRRILKERNLI